MMPPPPRPRDWDKWTDEAKREHIKKLTTMYGEPPPWWVTGSIAAIVSLAIWAAIYFA